MKKLFKGLFKSRKDKAKKDGATPTTNTAAAESSTHAPTKPTETTPAAPAPVTAPTPAHATTKADTEAPVTSDAHPAAPVPAVTPSIDGPKKDETAALTEVKKTTESRSNFNYTISPNTSPATCAAKENNCSGSRWRLKVESND